MARNAFFTVNNYIGKVVSFYFFIPPCWWGITNQVAGCVLCAGK